MKSFEDNYILSKVKLFCLKNFRLVKLLFENKNKFLKKKKLKNCFFLKKNCFFEKKNCFV